MVFKQVSVEFSDVIPDFTAKNLPNKYLLSILLPFLILFINKNLLCQIR